MASTLSQVISELNSVYDPQIKNIQARQALIPGQIADEEKGLEAKKTASFEEILGGARRRGIGFSGIPLAEQAKYTATDFLPALARLRQTGREQAMSLEDAILGLRRDQRTQGQSIFDANRNYDLANRQFAESIRQFNAQMAEQARQRQEAAKAARAAAYSGGYVGGASAKTTAAAKPKTDPLQQRAYNDVATRIQGDVNSIKSDYRATLDSANRGNVYDKYKIELYSRLRPDIFGSGVSVAALGNGGQLRY